MQRPLMLRDRQAAASKLGYSGGVTEVNLTGLSLTLEIPQLEALMADVQQVLADVRSLKSDLGSRLDTIDNVIERLRAEVAAGDINQATLDEIATEVSGARTSLASVDPEDPSGDDAPQTDPGDGGGGAT
jgi:hypothetical protein